MRGMKLQYHHNSLPRANQERKRTCMRDRGMCKERYREHKANEKIRTKECKSYYSPSFTLLS